MLIKKVHNALQTECKVHKDEKLVLAFSGGSDSVCLLHILAQLEYEIIVAYFNHNLRDEVIEEEQFTIMTARNYACKYAIGSELIADIANNKGAGIEETARKYRYRFLCDTAKKFDAKAIAVAHHADDQVETMLMNLIRGSGLSGLTGMKFKSFPPACDDIPVVRPMLRIWKDEILAYCHENSLEFKEDQTNQDVQYTRNKLRQLIIPKIQQINPQFKTNLLRTQTILEEDEHVLREAASQLRLEMIIKEKENYIKFDIHKFRKIGLGLQRRVILQVLHEDFNIQQDISFLMIENICKVFRGDINSNFAKITDQLLVSLEANQGILYSDPKDLVESDALIMPDDVDRIIIPIPGITKIDQNWSLVGKIMSAKDISENYTPPDAYSSYFDLDKIHPPLILRRWLSGDRFAPMGMRGRSMKMGDFWINKKFPKKYRAHFPLVCDGEKIIWMPGFQPADKCTITSDTRNVLLLQFKKTQT